MPPGFSPHDMNRMMMGRMNDGYMGGLGSSHHQQS